MIIRSSYVGDDPDRERHLLDGENNECVIERSDLDRSAPGDLRMFLRTCSALTAANARARITLAHIKCSPSLDLTEQGLLRLMEVVEREHKIPSDHPRRVLIHMKGNRPAHVHLLYPAVSPRTGRVLSSKMNYQADELAGRILELEFGEQIVPGPRIQKNAEVLHERGETAMAEVLAQYEPVRNRDRDTEADRQQGARTKMRSVEFRRLLAAALAASGPALPVPRALSTAGFAIALGDRRDVLIAVHMPSGAAYSLERSLKKIVPNPMVISDDDLGILRSQASPLAEVVRSGLVSSHRRAEAKVDREIRKGLFEAAVDGDLDSFLAEQRRRRAKIPRGNEEMSQRARRVAIRAAEQTASILQERRTKRALRAARILPTPARRKEAAALAASGALLAGPDFAMRMGGELLVPAAIEASQRRSRKRSSLDSREQNHAARLHKGMYRRSAVGKALSNGAPEAMVLPFENVSFPRAHARPVEDVAQDGLSVAHRRAEAQVDHQIRRGLFEAAIDGEHDHVFTEAHRNRAKGRPLEEEMSDQARRTAIRAAEQEARFFLQRRIDRAFRAARILQTPALRKAAFALALSGGLLAGASFPIAIGAGFMVAELLKGQAAAQRADARALIDERNQIPATTRKARGSRPSQTPATFDFNIVPKESRVLAGIALRHMAQGWSTDLTAAVARALGPGIMDGLRALHETGSEKQKRAVTGWASSTSRHVFAAASALRRAGEVNAAATLEQGVRRGNAKTRDPDWSRVGG